MSLRRASALMPEFTAQIARLEELFAKRCAIAWTAVEAGQLLEDLASAADDSAARGPEDYFLGTMLFIDREPTTPERRRVWQRGGTSRTLDVVDGFQRLTSLTILLCVLRDCNPRPSDRRLAAAIEVAGGTGRARLTLAAPDDAFFAEHVRNAGATSRPAAVVEN